MQDDSDRALVRRMRRRSIRTPLLVSGGMCALAVGFACVTTEPLFAESPPRSAAPDGARERLEATVRALSEAPVARDAAHPEELEAVIRLLHDELEHVGAKVEEQRFEARGSSYANVLTHFGPDGGPRVILGAHYDVCGAKPGADDNASGVAGLLEIARRLAAEPPEGRIDVVFYTLEEPPFFATEQMGSFVHAASLHKAGVDVKAMIALEMIGVFSDAPGSQRFPSSLVGVLYPSRGDFVAVVGDIDQIGLTRSTKRAMTQASPLPVRSINAPKTMVGIDFSDHRSYWAFGFPAVMVTDTAFFRNPRYHTDLDTAGTLDYARMAEVLEGTLAAARRLASGQP